MHVPGVKAHTRQSLGLPTAYRSQPGPGELEGGGEGGGRPCAAGTSDYDSVSLHTTLIRIETYKFDPRGHLALLARPPCKKTFIMAIKIIVGVLAALCVAQVSQDQLFLFLDCLTQFKGVRPYVNTYVQQIKREAFPEEKEAQGMCKITLAVP